MRKTTNKNSIERTTWINTIHPITDEPKEWAAFPVLWINDSYVCIYNIDGEKMVIKIKK